MNACWCTLGNTKACIGCPNNPQNIDFGRNIYFDEPIKVKFNYSNNTGGYVPRGNSAIATYIPNPYGTQIKYI